LSEVGEPSAAYLKNSGHGYGISGLGMSVVPGFLTSSSCPSLSVVGAVWFLYFLSYNLSVALWVGIIALAGVAAETGVVMIVYLKEVYDRKLREGSMAKIEDL